MAQKPLTGTKTQQNLKDAFAAKAEANQRYLNFAKAADAEGCPDIAGLFKDTAATETVHAQGHLDYLKSAADPVTGLPIGKTEKNVKSALASETSDYEMYKRMSKEATMDGYDDIAQWFDTVAKAEKSHADRFNKALSMLNF